ncbi:hydrophobin 1 [Crepidotus variabilis]|uniref:Hydrophobin n=1 Tax=Crepidotus variabilis TaxID=179855 RepID=A0A9P6EGG4_9AGAR|nr:hydrophobin 1 [Crepidotus variabilis]KAF9528294.1 hydrophobin 1 [Crepidotus variabilis]
MQFKLATLVSLTIASFAAATPLVARGGDGGSPPPTSQCNTGSVQCCNSVQSANSGAAAGLLALLGVVVQDVTAQVGITCSPISAVGIGGNSCSSQPVCCQNNNFNGVVAIGCTPVNVNL